jgi:hypothetical protein
VFQVYTRINSKNREQIDYTGIETSGLGLMFLSPGRETRPIPRGKNSMILARVRKIITLFSSS